MKFLQVVLSFALILSTRFGSTGFADQYLQDPESVRPLGPGEIVPRVSVESISGEVVDLRKALEGTPTVLIFYRGGWCPYCNRHLSDVQSIAPDLRAMGFQIVAISPDRPEVLRATLTGQELDYHLLSDRTARAIEAFGLAFQLEEQVVELYRNRYKIDLEKDSGETHHLLPVPALYLVDGEGRLQFRFFDPNYKKRISSKEVLTAAKSMQK